MLALAVAALVPVRLQSAEVIEITPVADTFIAEYFPTKNFGAMTFFNGGTTQNFTTNRGLLKFDLASVIPGGSKILSVSLGLEVTGQPDEPWNSANFGLHRMLRDWGEGDNTGSKPSSASAAGTNEANWNYRFAFTSETWGQPGGQAGVDYVPSPSTTTWVYEAGNPYAFESSSALVADAQLWLDQPGTNFGWMLIVQNETTDFTARRFGSRESAFDKPRLTVTFQPPPPIDGVAMVNNLFNLSFTTITGYVHQVQYRASLPASSWQALANIGPFTNATRVVVVDTGTAAQRFYRLVLK